MFGLKWIGEKMKSFGATFHTGKLIIVEAGVKGGSLQFTRNGNAMNLAWGPGWFLQSSTNAAGPYFDVNDATSPWPII